MAKAAKYKRVPNHPKKSYKKQGAPSSPKKNEASPRHAEECCKNYQNVCKCRIQLQFKTSAFRDYCKPGVPLPVCVLHLPGHHREELGEVNCAVSISVHLQTTSLPNVSGHFRSFQVGSGSFRSFQVGSGSFRLLPDVSGHIRSYQGISEHFRPF